MRHAAVINAVQAEFDRMDKRERELRQAGALLSNCAYNLAQRPHLTAEERRSLDESRRAWDALVEAHALADVPQ
jgi:uncharacterized membrane protein YccC